MRESTLRLKRRLVFFGGVVTMFAALSCDSAPPMTVPDAIVVTATPSSVNLLVGENGSVGATVTGGDASTNRTAVTFTSSNPGVVTVTANGAEAAIKAVGVGTATITVRHESGATTTMTVQVGPAPILQISGLHNSQGANVTPNNISGVLLVDLTTNAVAANVTGGNLLVDNTQVGTCAAIQNGRLTCTLDTAQLPPAGVGSGAVVRGLIQNGAHVLGGRIQLASGLVVTAPTTNIATNNQNRLSITRDGPPGDLVWRSADITVAVTPVLFGTNVPGPITVALNASGPPGSGALTFNQLQPLSEPFRFTINAAASASAEATYVVNPRVFDASATDIAPTFLQSPFTLNIDLVAPRVLIDPLPASVPLQFDAVTLGHTEGPFNAGAIIPLSRIINATVVAPHPPQCDATHLHGTISIRSADGTQTFGPFLDPEFGGGDPCGHGKVSPQLFTQVTLTVSGNVADASPVAGTLQLFRAVGACDSGPIIDDTPILQGSAAGQSPEPSLTVTQLGSFSRQFTLINDSQLINTTICVRSVFQDGVLNVQGQKVNTTTRVNSTRLGN